MAGAMLIDLYQFSMIQAYLDRGLTDVAAFEFFVRRLPDRRDFLLAAGLEQALTFLETLRFSADELDWLRREGHFSKSVVETLETLRFTGDVDAVPEGSIVFPDEPILRVVAPLPQAQLVESRLINIVHFQTLIASKAARMALAAPGKQLVDFGFRRAHGAEAGLMAARASYLAGFAGTATVEAGRLWGIPLFGTMAHSFIQAFDDESAAFEAFARSRPAGLVLLIDTYDTEAAARKVVRLAPRLAREGITIAGVRLDSGDLERLSRSVRRILDEGGLRNVAIFASGGIDEDDLSRLVRSASIDGFGVGTSLTTSSDAPALDCAYKLVEYGGRPRRKRSTGKATWPGCKQVWRRYGPDGRMSGDILSLEGDDQRGEPQLRPVLRGGRRVGPPPPLAEGRARAARELQRLPPALRRLEPGTRYPVEPSGALVQLAAKFDAETTALGEGS
jgi:nicotinate phosphoribosyltransferase